MVLYGKKGSRLTRGVILQEVLIDLMYIVARRRRRKIEIYTLQPAVDVK